MIVILWVEQVVIGLCAIDRAHQPCEGTDDGDNGFGVMDEIVFSNLITNLSFFEPLIFSSEIEISYCGVQMEKHPARRFLAIFSFLDLSDGIFFTILK